MSNATEHIEDIQAPLMRAIAAGRARAWTPEDEAREQRADRKRHAVNCYAESGLVIPKGCRFGSEMIRKLVDPRLTNGLSDWLPSDGPVLVSAKKGSGKTLLANAVVARLLGRYVESGKHPREARIMYTTVPQILAARKEAGWNKRPPMYDVWGRAYVLIIDELGKCADNKDRDLWELVDGRYQRDLPGERRCINFGLSGHAADGDAVALDAIYGDAFVERFAARKGGRLVEAW